MKDNYQIPGFKLMIKNFNFLMLILMIVGTNICNAQNQEISDFIPDGYVLNEKFNGDLNDDGSEDCILIVKNSIKENIETNQFGDKVDLNRRGIIVLIKNKKSYELVVENLNCFSSENEDGGVYFPPELSVKIEDGNLKIHFGHGRYGYWEYIFKYGKNGIRLIGYESSENRGPVISYKTSINFLTGKKLISENISEYSEGEDEVFKDTWHKIEVGNFIKLGEIKDFDKMDLSIY